MKRLAQSSARAKSRDGVAMIETALLLPLLLLLILNLANFGVYIFAWITVNNAARQAAEYAAYNGAAVNFITPPTFPQIQAMVNTDTGSLPNFVMDTNPTLQVCSSNANGPPTCSGSCTGVCTTPADPEPTLYTVNYVDVAYNYTPLFGAFDIPSLGISLTLRASVIHRQVAMRSMQ